MEKRIQNSIQNITNARATLYDIYHRSGGEQYLANHLRASQSARAKNTIQLCGI